MPDVTDLAASLPHANGLPADAAPAGLRQRCEVLGIEPSRPNWVRVAGIIHDGLPDLVKMPSAPPAEFHRGSFGEMTLRADGQVLAQQDIRIEREGATYGH